jgi:hypothetical protein
MAEAEVEAAAGAEDVAAEEAVEVVVVSFSHPPFPTISNQIRLTRSLQKATPEATLHRFATVGGRHTLDLPCSLFS